MQLSLADFTILYAKFLADSLTRKLIMVWSQGFTVVSQYSMVILIAYVCYKHK